jgi:UDP-N-acetylenolpyruvoylglucosamine reductase
MTDTTTIKPCQPVALEAAPLTTYRIGGLIDACYQPTTFDQAVATLHHIQATHLAQGEPLTVLGWGGNTIVASRGIRGAVLHTRKMDWAAWQNEAPGSHVLICGAGTHSAKVATMAEKAGLLGCRILNRYSCHYGWCGAHERRGDGARHVGMLAVGRCV